VGRKTAERMRVKLELLVGEGREASQRVKALLSTQLENTFMAACPKCGRPRVRKQKSTGLRYCPRCGVTNKPKREDKTCLSHKQ
jgi:ribosomal protein L37AE/L43A